MKVTFTDRAWEEYQHWRNTDQDMCNKLERLISEARRTPFSGTGKPEPLKGEQSGTWSRRITDEHRLVYEVYGKGSDQALEIVSCRYHYTKK
jgi:toxin YoeB